MQNEPFPIQIETYSKDTDMQNKMKEVLPEADFAGYLHYEQLPEKYR